MTTDEIRTELQTALMDNPTAAALFGYNVGDPYDSHFSRIGAISVILHAVAYVIALKETLLERWKQDVRAVADSTRYGTEAWWKNAAKQWREGEQTAVVDGQVGYAAEAAATTITPVAYAAVSATGRLLTLKAAADQGGNPTALTPTQLAQLQAYADAVKPLGIAVQCVSGPANPIALAATITYNPEVSLPSVQANVQQAINSHCAEIEFGGTLYIGRLAAAVMRAEGVIDCHIDAVTIRNAANPSAASPAEVRIAVRPYNGYCRLDTANSDISYQPLQ